MNSLAGRRDHNRKAISRIRVADAIIITTLEKTRNRKMVADLLGIDAPTISRAIRKIEIALCGKILVGTGASAKFTDLGEVACIELDKVVSSLCQLSAPTKIIPFSKYADRDELLIRCDVSERGIEKLKKRLRTYPNNEILNKETNNLSCCIKEAENIIVYLDSQLSVLSEIRCTLREEMFDRYEANRKINMIEDIRSSVDRMVF